MQYNKIFKWLLVCLFIVGIITAAYGFFNEWPEDKVWKNKKELAKTLPAKIKCYTDTLQVNLLTKSELKDRKHYVDSLNEVGKKGSAEAKLLTEEIEKSKGNAKKKLIEKYLPTIDSIATRLIEIEAEKDMYEKEVELEDYVTTYNEAKEYIANGDSSVDTILYGTYFMVAIAILALCVVIFVITGINNPMSLVFIFTGLIVIAILVIGAWKLAPGTPIHDAEYYKQMIAQGNKIDIPSEESLKLADSVLYLTYLLVGATIVSLVTSWIVSAIRK